MKDKENDHEARRRRAPSALTVEIPPSAPHISSNNNSHTAATVPTTQNGLSGIFSFLHPLKRATSTDDIFNQGEYEISTPSKPVNNPTVHGFFGVPPSLVLSTLIDNLFRQWKVASIAYTATLPSTPSSPPPGILTRTYGTVYSLIIFFTLVFRSTTNHIIKYTSSLGLRNDSENDVTDHTTDNSEQEDEGYDPDVDDYEDSMRLSSSSSSSSPTRTVGMNRNMLSPGSSVTNSRSLRSIQRKKQKLLAQRTLFSLCYEYLAGFVTRRCVSFLVVVLLIGYILFVAPFHYDVEEAVDYYHDIIEYSLHHDIVCTTQFPILYSYTMNAQTKELYREKQKHARSYGWTYSDLVALLLVEGQTLSYTITIAEEDRTNFLPCLRQYKQDREIPIRYIPSSHMYAACKQTKFIENISDRPLFLWTRQDALWRHPYHGVENLFLIHSSISQGLCSGKNKFSDTYCSYRTKMEENDKMSGSDTGSISDITVRIFNPYPDGTLYTANNFAGVSAFLGYPYRSSYSSMHAEYMLYPANPSIQTVLDELHSNPYGKGKQSGSTTPTTASTDQIYNDKYIPMGEIAPSTFCSPMGIMGTASPNELLWKLPQTSYWYPDLSYRVQSFRSAVWGASLWWTKQATIATQTLLTSSQFIDKSVPISSSLSSSSSSSSTKSTVPRHVVVVLRGWGSRSSHPDITNIVNSALDDWNPHIIYTTPLSSDTDKSKIPNNIIAEWLSSSPTIGTEVSSLCASTRRFDNEEDMFTRLPQLLHACNVRKILSEEEGEYYEDLFSGENSPEAWIPSCTTNVDSSNPSSSLPSLSITFVRLEVLPFAYQVLLVRSADIFLGGHGAAMVHGLWMRPQGKDTLSSTVPDDSLSVDSTKVISNDRKGILIELFPEASATLQLYSNLAQLAGAGYIRSFYKRTHQYEKRYLACAQYRGFLWTVARNVPPVQPTSHSSNNGPGTKPKEGDFASRSIPSDNIYWWKGVFNHPLSVEEKETILSRTDLQAYSYGQNVSINFRNAALAALSTVLTAENKLPNIDTLQIRYERNKVEYSPLRKTTKVTKKPVLPVKMNPSNSTNPLMNANDNNNNPLLTKARIQETLKGPLHPLARAAVGEGRVDYLEERLFLEGAGQLAGWSSSSSASESGTSSIFNSWTNRLRKNIVAVLSYIFSFFSPGEEWRVMVKDADIFIDIEEIARTIKDGLLEQEKEK